MISNNIRKTIIRYLTKSANTSELDELNDWLKNPKNRPIFVNYIKTYFTIILGMNNPDPKIIKEKLLREIRKEKHIFYRYKIRSIFKYAAIAVLFMGMGFLIKDGIFQNESDKALIPKEEAITLRLNNGNEKIISEEGSSQVVNSQGNIIGVYNGKKLIYKKKDSEEIVAYNILSVPYGKRFTVELSDGTQVFMNSGSSLRYPVTFSKKMKREVFLEGEAYFEVVHDKTRPFLVNAQELKVQVLGTKFNLSNYQEDNDTEVVLIEGSVSLSSQENPSAPKKETLLKPGYKGSFDKTLKNISSEKVNTTIYTSWVKGSLVFRKVPFENIIRKLERQYNVTIINNNEKLAIQTFNATIEVDNETIGQVFNYFNKVYHIDYKIVENKIIIN